MPSLNIVITGCSEGAFRQFTTKTRLGSVTCRQKERKLVCTLPSGQLGEFYSTIKSEADKGWKNPDDEDTLAFDSAYFPKSEEEVQPVRQLRGRVAARLARKMAQLPPARAVPYNVFGPEDEG